MTTMGFWFNTKVSNYFLLRGGAFFNKSTLYEIDLAYHYGRQRWMYYDTSDDGVMPLKFKNIYLKNILPYDTDRSESQSTDYSEVILTTDTVSELYLNNMVIDSSMSGKTTIVKDGVST